MIDYIKQFFVDAISSTETNQFFNAGLLLGAITSVLLIFKSWGLWLLGRIKRSITFSLYVDNCSSMYSAISDWYYSKYPHKFKNVEANTEYREEDGERNVYVKIRQFNDFNTLWYKGRLLFIYKTKRTLESAMNLETRSQDIYEISGIFAKKAINGLIQEAYEFYKSQENKIQGLKIVHHGQYDDIFRQILTDYKPLDKIFIKQKHDILEDITKFLSSKDFYLKRGIKVKRNYLLSGPAGTGKTTLVLGVASHFNKRVYYVNPSKFINDSNFEKLMYRVEPGSIILIEDIDIFFTHRERKKEDSTTSVTFQAILNVLDGATSPSEVLIFLTTNHYDKLDAALVRKGRVDYHAIIGYPEKEEVENFVEDFFGEKIELQAYLPKISMSDVQDICLRSKSALEVCTELKEKVPTNGVKVW